MEAKLTTAALEEILDIRDTLAELWPNMMAELESARGSNGSTFDFSKKIPQVNRSLGELDQRVIGLLDLLKSFEKIDNVLLLPTPSVNGLRDNLNQILSSTMELVAQLGNIPSNDGFGEINPENFRFLSANGSIDVQLGKPYANQIDGAIDGALNCYYPMFFVGEGKGFDEFSSAYSEFGRVLEAARQARKELEDFRKTGEGVLSEASQIRDQIGTTLSEAQAQRDEAQRLTEEAEKDRKNISEYTAEVTERLASVRETASKSEQLKNTVEGYQSQFDNFERQLKDREERIGKGNEEENRLINSLQGKEEETDRLIKMSESMLKGATVAGLASSFGEIRDNLASELESARRIFYFSILVLFATIVPLLLLLVPSFDPFATPEQTKDPAGFIAHAAVRLLLLLPAAWFAKFAAARHAVLFRLKEHYAYKYSIASSVEGFKKQAEPFQDEIAGAAFVELTFNPADRMETKGHEQRAPNRIMDYLMKKVGATYDGKGE